MTELSDKIGIAQLVEVCYERGLRRVVLSPGSRNAPLSISFLGHGGFDVHVVGDERSAAFIALGMSQSDSMSTILVCTSGTALLNYAPAVAEACYQRIPLLLLTADRPEEWVAQMEGQTMKQQGALSNYLNKEIQLPQEPLEADRIRYNERLVNEAISATSFPKLGPVHVNIPLKEPLYGTVERDLSKAPKAIVSTEPERHVSQEHLTNLIHELSGKKKVLLIIGLGSPGDITEECLTRLSEKGVVILSEATSNVSGQGVNSWIDRSLAAMPIDETNDYLPDLIISVGGPLISKRVKLFLRENRAEAHWHIDPSQAEIDLFQSLTRAIYAEPSQVLAELSTHMGSIDKGYSERWKNLLDISLERHTGYLAEAPFSDLKAYEQIMAALPRDASVQLANSAAVRYAQLFDHRSDLSFYSNRGVSGIDGCTSTALGMAIVQEGLVVLLSGDMAFRYDSNAFWNKERPENLKCIVVNNEGGGIFRFITGPDSTQHLENAFEAHQANSAKGIADLYDIPYLSADDEESLRQALIEFYETPGEMILEIFTPRNENSGVLRDYFASISKEVGS